MSNELVPRAEWDKKAIDLAYQYAGFTDAKSLTESEKVEALQTLVPTALQVVDEARDTIEHLRRTLDAIWQDEITMTVNMNVAYPMTYDEWSKISIPGLDNQTPLQLIEHDRTEALLDYVRSVYDSDMS